MSKLTVGQKLWWVGVWSRVGVTAESGREVTITSVGRKWAGIDRPDTRVDIHSLVADGGEYSSPGRCYLSREDYEREYILRREWEWLKRMFPARPPAHITPDAIQLIASVIGLEPRKTA